MSLLQHLEQLIGAHSQPAQKAPVMQAAHQLGIPLNVRGSTEDSAMVNGAQGFVPINADVAHFNVPGRGMQEDAYSVPSQQGYTPINADVAHFTIPTHQAQTMPFNPGFTPLQNSGRLPVAILQGGKNVNWQNVGGSQRNMVNPQVRDNGYYYGN